MRKLVLLLAAFPAALPAQSIQTVSPQHCVWRSGDNPTWAAPKFDDSAWQPLDSWKVSGDLPWMWLRCRVDLPALRNATHPALQVSAHGAYQIFFNGDLAGKSGNLRNGHFTMNSASVYPITTAAAAAGGDIIAVRMLVRVVGFSGVPPPIIAAGEAGWLADRRNSQELADALSKLPENLGFGIIGVLGFVLLGFYFSDRGRLELLLLAMVCWCLCIESLIHYFFAIPDQAYWAADALGELLSIPLVFFTFRIADRRVPWAYNLLLIAAQGYGFCIDASNGFSPVRVSLLVIVSYHRWLWAYLVCQFILAAAPFFAFCPWKRVPRPMRAVASLTTILASAWLMWWAGLLWAAASTTGLAFFLRWQSTLLDVRVLVTLAVILLLVELLLREQRRTARERAVLAGEMQAAQEIQRMLVPASVFTSAAIRMGVAFQPMREVGGDFYQCRVLPDGTQRLLLGDVSGKGAAAAMTATLLIGASRGRTNDSPSELLQHLNRALRESEVAGFVTCLCAHVAPDGTLTLANAGHLAPYRNGEELALDNGLPLGIADGATYSETTLQLAPNDRLTFLSDGVVEAQSPTGELFGFDRTARISTSSAEEIATAAQQFGQEDDITVLTLQYAPAEVLHA